VAPVNAADVTAALAGNATGVPATAADAPTVPVAEAMPAAPAAEAKAAAATAADAALAAHTKAAADMKGAADVKTATDTPPPATDDTTPPASPPANKDTPPATDATNPNANTNANDAASEVPLVPIEPALPATASETRSEIASVAAALSALESPVEATAPAHTATPRSAPAPIETAATAIAPDHAAAVSPMAQPQHVVPSQAAATEVVHAPATPTPTQPHEQVVAVLSPLSQRPDGVYKLRLELHPAELGRVEIDVEMRNGVLHANLRAEHVTAAHVLRDALADLRGRLDAQGVRTGNVTVDGRGPGNAGRERQSASSGEARRGDGGADGREERLLDEQQRSRRANDVNASMLDLRM
jgi:flagellar hook-length control protein FliK